MGRRAPNLCERRVGAELVGGLQHDGARQFVDQDVSLVACLRPAQARKGQLGSRGAPNCGSPTDEPRLSRTALGCPPGPTHEGLRSYGWGPFGEGTGAETLQNPATGGVSWQNADL